MKEYIIGIDDLKIQTVTHLTRCKDCKYGKQVTNAKGETMIDCLNADNWLKYPDWFCADGERKTDEED